MYEFMVQSMRPGAGRDQKHDQVIRIGPVMVQIEIVLGGIQLQTSQVAKEVLQMNTPNRSSSVGPSRTRLSTVLGIHYLVQCHCVYPP
jgi:hypothetical protein